MAKRKKNQPPVTDLVALEPAAEIEVLPPDSGVVGRFIEETQNMFRARAMRMKGLLSRIDESGQRTEALLRMAADRMESAEAQLEQDFVKEGLLARPEPEEED